jgi:hypothetical protein
VIGGVASESVGGGCCGSADWSVSLAGTPRAVPGEVRLRGGVCLTFSHLQPGRWETGRKGCLCSDVSRLGKRFAVVMVSFCSEVGSATSETR